MSAIMMRCIEESLPLEPCPLPLTTHETNHETNPDPPGEVLLEDFLKTMGISQYAPY
jgi:hypothetical protein